MSADRDAPGDTIVVGGEYESSVDEDMISEDDIDMANENGDANEAEQTEELVGEIQTSEASAVPTVATVDALDSKESSDAPIVHGEDTEAVQDVSNSQETSNPGPTSTAAAVAVPAPSPLGSAVSISSASISSASSDSSSPSASPSPAQQPAVPSPVQAQASHPDEQAPAPEQPVPETVPPPQTASASDQSNDAPTAASPLPQPRQESRPPVDNAVAGIEIDIQQLLDGIEAAASSSTPSAVMAPPRAPRAHLSASTASEGATAPAAMRTSMPSNASPTSRPEAGQGLQAATSESPSSASAPTFPPTVGRVPSAHHEPHNEAAMKHAVPRSASPLSATAPSQLAGSSSVDAQREGPMKAEGDAGSFTTPAAAISTVREPPTGPRAQTQKAHAARQNVNARNGGQTFEAYLADEKRFTAEARWERFPEGSRIFVGNLVQERVNKKDVFNLFHKYGRLAQISLKAAFGFVQYHNAADAAEAIRHLQGAPVAGRKINLEITKTQKKGKDPRDFSPDRFDRNSKRGGFGGNSSRSYDNGRDGRDGRDGGRDPDGYRPSYDPRSRRGDRYNDDSSRSRRRSRSRSPRSYSRSDNHRQRSPQRSSHGDGRYGHDSRDDSRHGDGGRGSQKEPIDAQILMLEEVHPDFRGYVQKAFSDRGLKTDAMFVDPRFVDNLIQRQIVDGVLAVIKLDMQAQSLGKVTIQVFNRAPGAMQVTFDEYRLVDVNVAVELVVQKKQRNGSTGGTGGSSGATTIQPTTAQQPQHAMAAAAYQPQAPPLGYPQAAAAAPVYPYQMTIPQLAAVGAAVANPGANLMGALGQLDPAVLQKVIMAMHAQQQGGQQPHQAAQIISPPPQAPAIAPAPTPSASAPSQINIQAILSSLRNTTPGTAAAGGAAPPQQASLGYGVAGGYGASHAAMSGGQISMPHTSAAGTAAPGAPAAAAAAGAMNPQVQSILAELARIPR